MSTTVSNVASPPRGNALSKRVQQHLWTLSRQLGEDTANTTSDSTDTEPKETKVVMRDMSLKDEGCQAVCDRLCLLPARHRLVHLDLRGNDIGALGCRALAELIRSTNSIHTLCMEWNALSTPGAFAYLCDALAHNQSVASLDIRNNRLGPDAGILLGALLSKNSTLSHIDIRWNELGTIGGQAIADALSRNRVVTTLLVSGNGIPVSITRAIEECVASNGSIQMDHRLKKLGDDASAMGATQFTPSGTAKTASGDSSDTPLRFSTARYGLLSATGSSPTKVPMSTAGLLSYGSPTTHPGADASSPLGGTLGLSVGMGMSRYQSPILLQHQVRLMEEGALRDQQAIHKLTASLDDAHRELEAERAANARLTGDLEATQEKLEQLMKEKAALSTHVLDMAAQLEQQKNISSAFQSELQSLRQLRQDGLDAWQRERETLTRDNAAHVSKISDMQQHIDQLRSDHSQAVLELHNQIKDLQARLSQEVSQRHREKEEHNSMLETREREVGRRMVAVEDEWSRRVEVLEQRLRAADDDKARLRTQLSDSNHQLAQQETRHQQRLREMEESLRRARETELQQTQRSLETRINELQRAADEERNKRDKTEAERSAKLNEALSDLQRSRESIHKEATVREDLQRQLTSSMSELSQLRAESQSSRQHILSLESTLAQLRASQQQLIQEHHTSLEISTNSHLTRTQALELALSEKETSLIAAQGQVQQLFARVQQLEQSLAEKEASTRMVRQALESLQGLHPTPGLRNVSAASPTRSQALPSSVPHSPLLPHAYNATAGSYEESVRAHERPSAALQ